MCYFIVSMSRTEIPGMSRCVQTFDGYSIAGCLYGMCYLNSFYDDREVVVSAVSSQQVLTVAREGKELVVKRLEVRLACH